MPICVTFAPGIGRRNSNREFRRPPGDWVEVEVIAHALEGSDLRMQRLLLPARQMPCLCTHLQPSGNLRLP